MAFVAGPHPGRLHWPVVVHALLAIHSADWSEGDHRSAEGPPRVFYDLEPLIALDLQGKPAERLATHWVWEKDGRVLRVTLRQAVNLHDGAPFNSHVRGSHSAPRDCRSRRALLRVDCANRRLPDEHTLLFLLSRPDAFLIEILATTLIIDAKKPNIGTGPFRVIKTAPALEA